MYGQPRSSCNCGYNPERDVLLNASYGFVKIFPKMTLRVPSKVRLSSTTWQQEDDSDPPEYSTRPLHEMGVKKVLTVADIEYAKQKCLLDGSFKCVYGEWKETHETTVVGGHIGTPRRYWVGGPVERNLIRKETIAAHLKESKEDPKPEESIPNPFVHNGPCEKCNTPTRFFCNIPRWGMGWNVCPNCSPGEYYNHWPSDEAKDISKRLRAAIKAAEAKELAFREEYEKNPSAAINKYSS